MISPIEVAPASNPGQIKMCRVTHRARKQVVFRLDEDQGRPVDLTAEVQNPPAKPADWAPQKDVNPANTKIRLRTSPGARWSPQLYGSFKIDVEGQILDQKQHRGFVQFELDTSTTGMPGIFEAYIEQYIPNGKNPDDVDSGWRIQTWPVLISIEPTTMAILSGYSSGPLLIPEIRLAMLDTDNQSDGAPFSNLLDDTEFTDLDIIFAQRRVVQLWNETPPPICQYSVQNFPYRYWWLECTVGHLLVSGAQRYRKNRLAYQAGGIAIDDQSKSAEYEQIGQQKIQKFMEWMRTEKVRRNMNSTWSTGI